MRCLTFSFANAMMQLIRGEQLSLKHLTQGAPAAFPFGLGNATGIVGHLMVQRMHPSPTNDEFMGMTEYVVESFHDLLAGELELPFNSDSSRGSHHPSHENFVVGTPEGDVEGIHEGEAIPTNNFDNEVERDAGAPPRLWVEQLKAWHQEVEEARL